MAAEKLILYALCRYGLDREAMVQLLQPGLEEYAAVLVHGLINVIMCWCGTWLLPFYAAEEEDDSPAASPSPTTSQGGTPAPAPSLLQQSCRLQQGGGSQHIRGRPLQGFWLPSICTHQSRSSPRRT